MRMSRNIIGTILFLLLSINFAQAYLPTNLENALRSWFNAAGKLVGFTAIGTITADKFEASDQVATGANQIRLLDNDVDITPNPTCANVGVANTITLLDIDESATDVWVVCAGTTEALPLSSVVPNCPVAGSAHLTYDAATHAWGCD